MVQSSTLRRLFFSALVSACTTIALGQFETRSTSSVVVNPDSIAVGDFNHDGKLDMAVASQGNNSAQLTILLGNGVGTFKRGVQYNVVDDLYSVAAADLNGDGNLDLVVAEYLNSQVGVLMGNGDGTFQTAVNYPVPPGPTSVLVGDFNGNHWPDIVALEFTGNCNCISVLLNNGDGTFQAAKSTTAPSAAQAIGIGDFNRDGKLDVVTAGQSLNSPLVDILLGNGDGTFTAGVSYQVGSIPAWVAVADFRRNGILDLAVAGTFGAVAVLLGNGDGTFQSAAYYDVSAPNSLATADFNGDGKADIVVADDDPAQHMSGVSVLFGNGDGTFETAIFFPTGDEASPVAVGDFNGDKKPDIATADHLYSNVTALLNTGVVSFSPTTPLNFKKVKVGTTSAPLTVTLTNTGKSALTISSMKTTGQFAQTSTCGSSVPAGANCSISVTFSPTSTGAKSGTVTLHDSASSKPMVIELSGTGD